MGIFSFLLFGKIPSTPNWLFEWPICTFHTLNGFIWPSRNTHDVPNVPILIYIYSAQIEHIGVPWSSAEVRNNWTRYVEEAVWYFMHFHVTICVFRRTEWKWFHCIFSMHFQWICSIAGFEPYQIEIVFFFCRFYNDCKTHFLWKWACVRLSPVSRSVIKPSEISWILSSCILFLADCLNC